MSEELMEQRLSEVSGSQMGEGASPLDSQFKDSIALAEELMKKMKMQIEN